jgi:hypothetical protein
VDRTTYQQWWQLHLRVARGDSLSPDEQSSYHAGRRELEREEQLLQTTEASESRRHLAALEAEHADLERQRQKLDRRTCILIDRRLSFHQTLHDNRFTRK